MDGIEVVQVYVRDRNASVVRPVKELKGFQRIDVPARMQRTLCFRIPVDMLCLTDHSGQRVVEPGWFELMVGSSSADIALRGEFEAVGGQKKILPKLWRMESQCEFSHPQSIRENP